MRALLAAAIAAFWILQSPASQPVTPPREAAYTANNRGVALLEQFVYDDAARAFRDALRLAPGLEIARLNLAIADFYAGRPAEAAAGARASAAAMATNPTAHFMVGLIAKAENRIDDAAAAFARVLEIDPADAGTLIALGQIRLQERRYADALPLFDRALAAEPYNVTAAYSAALALTRAGRAEDGRVAMQRFERLRDSAYGVTYAQTYLAQGRYAEAIASTGAEPELVDPATPAVRFEDATSEWMGARGGAPAPAGTVAGVTLFDANGDGTLELLTTGASGVRFFRNLSARITDDTPRAGLQDLRDAAGAIAGDYDNDGRPDLFILTSGGARLYKQRADGGFDDVTRAVALPPSPASLRTAAFADLDHDGDLDIVVAGDAVQVLRNNGNGSFADITAESGVRAASGPAIAVAATDYDNRRDIDVLMVGRQAAMLFRNMRDGTFRESAADAGLAAPGAHTALAVADVNKDGYPDVFLARADAPGVLALSDGRGRFTTVAGPQESAGAIAAAFVDYDNDGLLDLLTLSPRSLKLARNVGRGQWSDVTRASDLASIAAAEAVSYQAMALGDLDGDGDTDVVIRTNDGVRLLRNGGGTRNASLRVRLTARASNRSAAGAKVEIRAGSLRQVVETSSSSPAVAPADVVLGLGTRRSADVVRVLWPSGILQAETATTPAPGTRDLAVAELDRKPSSCPYLFTWNGRAFEFITDFMGGGEMGGWAGPGQWTQPDPDEYVRISGDRLRPRDGRYELRVTNELEEALFVDRLQLVTVDHPAGTAVYPNEGLRQVRVPFRLYTVRDLRAPVRAADEHGHDVLAQVAAVDRRYPDDFTRLPIRGYAAAHALDLDLGPASANAVLLLTGWTDYAFSSDNVAAAQGGAAMAPPSLQVRDAAGAWRTVIEDVGFPVGRPQTIAVDLAGKFLSASREVRILTTMRIYWDQVQVATPVSVQPRLTRLPAASANLHWRGFSAESSPDGREPFGYDYARVSTDAPWKVPAGRYTREGDVRALVSAVDDMFAISRSGDELAVAFDAGSAAAVPPGWTRTFLLYAHGYSKEMNPRSATPDTVAPLPFRAMTRYPYDPAAERFPWTLARRQYDARYNTRLVTRNVPAIGAVGPR